MLVIHSKIESDTTLTILICSTPLDLAHSESILIKTFIWLEMKLDSASTMVILDKNEWFSFGASCPSVTRKSDVSITYIFI